MSSAWKVVASVALSLSIAIIGVIGYYIHTMPLSSRLVCATERYLEVFSPICRAHIRYFLSGETPEERELMSSHLYLLLNISNTDAAFQDNALELVDMFIDRGADINYPVRGMTPLHYAVGSGMPVLVRFLIKRGADPEISTSGSVVEDGLTPLELARKLAGGVNSPHEDWEDVIAILENHQNNARASS